MVLDIRYATENNFTGTQIYTGPEAYARRPVAALLAIQEELATRGLGLKILMLTAPMRPPSIFMKSIKTPYCGFTN